MGKPPSGTDNVRHPTDLQRRLAAEVKAGLTRTGKKPADLARETGIKPPYVTQMLNFSKQGTIGSWDLLLKAVGVAGWLPPQPVGLPVVEHVDQVEQITLTDQGTGKSVSYPVAPLDNQEIVAEELRERGFTVSTGGGIARDTPPAYRPPEFMPKPPPPPRLLPEPNVSSDEDFAPRTRR